LSVGVSRLRKVADSKYRSVTNLRRLFNTVINICFKHNLVLNTVYNIQEPERPSISISSERVEWNFSRKLGMVYISGPLRESRNALDPALGRESHLQGSISCANLAANVGNLFLRDQLRNISVTGVFESGGADLSGQVCKKGLHFLESCDEFHGQESWRRVLFTLGLNGFLLIDETKDRILLSIYR
jgi:hypothetical protein